MLIDYIKRVFKEREEKKYEYIYIAVDIHNSIFQPCFDKEETFQYFDYAKEVLQILSQLKFVKLILWTSTYKEKIDLYISHFEENNIHFSFVNENPMVKNGSFACFDSKFYCDIGIDDKFGFNAENEWKLIFELLK